MDFRLGELFSGPGGLGLGAQMASFKHRSEVHSISHAWATDYDRDTCDTYRSNLGGSKSVLCQDIRKLKFDSLRAIRDIDALAFGFPCNDFSIVGKQKGIDGVYGPLYQYCVEAVDFFKPKWFVAENVAGLRNANDGEAFRIILDEFSALGYQVYPHLYKFDQYGVPQTRHRIIIVGIANEYNFSFLPPCPSHYKNTNISARNALENPPIPASATNQEYTKQSKMVIERLSHIKPGENVFNANLPEHLKLNIRGAKISQIYKRLSPDKPAYTLTGSGGGGTHCYHWSENRALTNRERARLQTFPDKFVFSGSKESVRKQIGMAVPPKGASIVFKAILKTFADISYRSTQQNINIQSEIANDYSKSA